jgi:hypothetical protein
MRPHHQRAIQKLTEHISTQEEYLALIIGGSIAKGLEREDSDIDVVLVVTDEAFKERWAENKLIFFSLDYCDYPGGYVDGKIVNLDYIKAAAERANEVTRAAFNGAFVAYSRIPGLDDVIRRIPVYQPQEKQEKIKSFYAQFVLAYWYLLEGVRKGDRFLLNHYSAEMVLYAGRLILAHNEILYPFHKLLLRDLLNAPDKPENLMELLNAVLESPGRETAKPLYDAVIGFRLWNEALEPYHSRYIRDTELAWLLRTPYIGDA